MNEYLKKISGDEKIIIKVVDKNTFLEEVQVTFPDISYGSNFDNLDQWGLDKPSEIKVSVYEMIKDGIFQDLFNSPESQAITLSQVVSFCKNHKKWLREGCSGIFFLFKFKDGFLVADVNVEHGELKQCVFRRLDDEQWWFSEDCRLVILP